MNKIKLNSSILFVGDIHFEEDSIEENFSILQEILTYPKECIFIQLGDLTDKNKLNAVELEALTEYVKTLSEHFSECIFIDGNHSKQDKNNSIINYLRYLDNNIQVFQDELTIEYGVKNILVGHFFIDKSNGAFGDFRYTLEELKNKFDYVFLGHQHDFQKIDENFYHLGSIRFTSFGENLTYDKVICLLKDSYLHFRPIEKLIKYVDIFSLEELEQALEATQCGKLKVRYIVKSFQQLKNEIETLKKYKNAFEDFKIKNDFIEESTINKLESKEKFDSKQLINNWISQIEDKDVKELLSVSFKDAL